MRRWEENENIVALNASKGTVSVNLDTAVTTWLSYMIRDTRPEGNNTHWHSIGTLITQHLMLGNAHISLAAKANHLAC